MLINHDHSGESAFMCFKTGLSYGGNLAPYPYLLCAFDQQ